MSSSVPSASGSRPVTPLVVRCARFAGAAIVLTIVCVVAWGLPYYASALPVRVRHPLHPWLKSSGVIGQSLGILALTLFLFLWLYPLRKKIGRRLPLGSIPRWLDVHIVAGLLVPLVAAAHATFRFKGLIGLGYAAMFVVFLSGLVGRYLYVHIPRSRSGAALNLDEAASWRRQLLHDIATATGRPVPEIEARLAPRTKLSPSVNPIVIIGRMIVDDWVRRKAVRGLATELARDGASALLPDRRREVLRLARREMALAQQLSMLDGAKRVFRWWHAAHRPFAFTAVIAVLLHVGVAVVMGQTWFY